MSLLPPIYHQRARHVIEYFQALGILRLLKEVATNMQAIQAAVVQLAADQAVSDRASQATADQAIAEIALVCLQFLNGPPCLQYHLAIAS